MKINTIKLPDIDGVKIYCYPVENPRGAVIICPGGGFEIISKREDIPVASAYNDAGYNAFVLHYEIDHYPLFERPLQQLARTVSYVRNNSSKYGHASDKIAVIGFSAGAHVAAQLGVSWNRPERIKYDIDKYDIEPNALILCYPLITGGIFTHKPSMLRLMGDDRTMWDYMSLEKCVSRFTPPSFLWHTYDDKTVPVENSLLFISALRQSEVAFEAHIYDKGVHGMSLATQNIEDYAHNSLLDKHIASWFSLSLEWLERLFCK